MSDKQVNQVCADTEKCKYSTILNNFAAQTNCIIGVSDPKPLPYYTDRFTPFVSTNPIRRSSPAASLSEVKSIVVVGVPIKFKAFKPPPEGAGILSVLGALDDYHIIVNSLLKNLVNELSKHYNFKHKILVDSPSLDERALAIKAGLGFLGKNGLVISKKYGSWFNIGVLLTDIACSWDKKLKNEHHQKQPQYTIESHSPTYDSYVNTCPPNCNKCINACPSGALSDTTGILAAKCISYLTQKDDLTPQESENLGQHLYGCDICQDICPKNQNKPIYWAMPEDWLNMTDAELVSTYGNTAMMWRGTKLLRRNAKAIIANRRKEAGTHD